MPHNKHMQSILQQNTLHCLCYSFRHHFCLQGKGNELALGRHGRLVKILQKLLKKATLLNTYKRTHMSCNPCASRLYITAPHLSLNIFTAVVFTRAGNSVHKIGCNTLSASWMGLPHTSSWYFCSCFDLVEKVCFFCCFLVCCCCFFVLFCFLFVCCCCFSWGVVLVFVEKGFCKTWNW